jgi:hypothetical protein
MADLGRLMIVTVKVLYCKIISWQRLYFEDHFMEAAVCRFCELSQQVQFNYCLDAETSFVFLS